ncbi:eamA-like transporter family protein [Synechococcus sp. BIOS-E4-1]|uniref:EamA family transporter n=1 Tax=Synechococcus sp. BIOS-E4-1 TaxID=1400864 RepID=UPI00164748AD|nr:EamA family transporter [Synechococcus sp. BIOS-E4-1]QNI54404.1 eamA-like transporter family protein [Synechococcus sp. BIOS-E4-1]
MLKGIAWGISTSFLFSVYIVLSKYLLGHFASPWLLLASGVGIVALLPSIIKRRHVYKEWNRRQWRLVVSMALLSGLFNFSALLCINYLPASIAAMFLSLSSVVLLLRTCSIESRPPIPLELAAVVFAAAGAFLVLGVKIQTFPFVGLLFGVSTLIFSTSADILTGRMRGMVNVKEVVFSKQLSKVAFACLGLILISRLPAASYPALAVLWILLLAAGILKMLESFTASKTVFALPPVTFQNILLLNLPIVAFAESWIFDIHLDFYQWIGVVLIMLSALSAIFSGQKRLKAL